MRYLGGKFRVGKWIEENLKPLAQRNSHYLEPFVGGGAVLARMAKYFDTAEAGDAHEDLILMWQAAQAGWTPPESVAREDYDRLRHSNPSALRGFVGYGASFSGKWFGGYVDQAWDPYHKRMTRPYAQTASRAVLRDAAKFGQVLFKHRQFDDWAPGSGTLVYCDPPYAETTGYDAVGKFDTAAFWQKASEWADAGADVVVSESRAPSGWIVLAERTRAHMLRATKGQKQEDRAERLFYRGAVPALELEGE